MSVIVDDRMTLLDLEKKLAGREIKGSDELLFHDEREPLFDAYGVNDGLDEAQSPVVPLRNGGRITIESTLALTAIDVDMGGSGGKQRSDDAVFAMNNTGYRAIPATVAASEYCRIDRRRFYRHAAKGSPAKAG